MRERDAGLERRGFGILAFVSMTVAWGVLPAAQGPVERPGRAVAESRSPVAEDYVIAVDDELDLYVVDMPEISRLYRVSPTGTMTLALPPVEIKAAGLTPGGLAQVVADKLRDSGMMTHPHVTVQVKESRVHSVVIGGAVRRPQIYPLYSKTTLLDLLSQAEGLADDAGETALIRRGDLAIRALGGEAQHPMVLGGAANPDSVRTLKVNLKFLFEGGDANVELFPGDRVTVERAGVIYVVGAVNRAGGFPLRDDREGMTVLKAIALAENLKSTAVPKKAVIIRRGPQAPGQSQEIPVDLKRILSGRAPDRSLTANDILFVPDSAGKKAAHRAAEAALAAATLVVYRVPF